MANFNLYSPEINEVLDEYGAVSLFLPKHKINPILNNILNFNKSDNIFYFTDHLSSSTFERLNNKNVHYHFLIEFNLLLERYTKKDLIIIDLVYAYSLNFANPMSDQIASRMKQNYFIENKDDFKLEKNSHANPLFIFVIDESEIYKERISLFKDQLKKTNSLKYTAVHQTPIQAYLYKHSPFDSDIIEFNIKKHYSDQSILWYPCQSDARFTQNELRKKAFAFLPGKIDPEMVLSEFHNYHDEFWPFIFSLDEIKKVLYEKQISSNFWHKLWQKSNSDGESFNPEVYNNWWFILNYINESNIDQQRKVLEFEYYPSLKKIGRRNCEILAEILIKIPVKRRYNLMKYWSRSEKNELDCEEIFGLIEDIPKIYDELTPIIKETLNFDKVTSWDKLHDYLSEQQALLDYGILPLPSQVSLKFLEQKLGDFRCIIPYSPPEIKKLGKIFHNCLFSFTSRVQKGEICIATFFDNQGQNLCVAFLYDQEKKILHFEQALAKDNQKASSLFVEKAKQYIINKINQQ